MQLTGFRGVAMALAALVACNGKGQTEVCGDGLDNDFDGQSDCADLECATQPDCLPDEDCNNNDDDDGDGDVDCDDSDCADDAACEVVPPEDCNNGTDDDDDGDVDCDDSECSNDADCLPPEFCDDGIDNDGDGDVDCDDSDCSNDGACFGAEDCDDGIDNDGDGRVDCADANCATDPACDTTAGTEDCNNGTDDDQDGAVDCADPDCAGSSDCWVPYLITATGWFAYDQASDTVRSAVIEGQDIPPTIVVFLVSEDALSNPNSTEACSIYLSYNGANLGPIVTNWTFTTTGTFTMGGFILPAGQYDVVPGSTTDCDHMAATWGTVDDIAGYSWGLGVGTMSSDVRTAITQGGDDPDAFAGAGFYASGGNGFPDGMAPYLAASGYGVDPTTFDVLNSAGDPATSADFYGNLVDLDPADIDNGSGVLPTGWYTTDIYYGYILQ